MLHLVWSREKKRQNTNPTPTGIFLLTASDWEFCAQSRALLEPAQERGVNQGAEKNGRWNERLSLVRCVMRSETGARVLNPQKIQDGG